MNKIVDIVSMNDGHAYVIHKDFKLTYEKHGDILIGSDETGTFFDVLYYSHPVGRREYGAYAFGGREFDLAMKDGTTTHCWGQYWSGHFKDAEKILGIEFANFPHNSIEGLKDCYVFCSGTADKSKLQSMVNTFFEENPDFEVWDYWDYQKYIKSGGYQL